MYCAQNKTRLEKDINRCFMRMDDKSPHVEINNPSMKRIQS